MNSYIYIRDNEWYKSLDIYKIGITTSIKDRNSSYITGEYIKGTFIKIYELYQINNNKLRLIDKYLKNYFKYLHKYNNGGTEFYDRSIINKIEIALGLINIHFSIIDDKELKYINRYNVKNKFSNLIYKLIINNTNDDYNKIIPKDYQQEIIDKINNYYYNNDNGKLIWACGIGKTLMSILIIKKLNLKKVLIGVYSSYLQNQFAEEILKVFNNINNILLIGSCKNSKFNITTNIIKINEFLNDDNNYKFIITTYHSCHLFNNDEFKFDFKISDECHHLVGSNNNDDNKKFIEFHNIKSSKSLFMTATEKININDKSYSMDNTDIYGSVIDIKTVKWAIDNKKITNYKIIIINNNIDELIEIKDKINSTIKNKDLYISVYMALKSLSNIKQLSHILIYTNTIEDAKLANIYITEILSYDIIDIDIQKLYHTSLHSEMKSYDIKECLNKFETYKYGIISCVQIFGEGVNCPILNGVCIACNMNSEIRIVQYLLRPNRLNNKNPDKIAYYILPYISQSTFDNIRVIIRQLANVDETIEQKIMVLNISNNYETEEKIKEYVKEKFILNENQDLLLKIKMQLKHNKDIITPDFTEEENEYNYMKSVNKYLNILSKNQYYNSIHIHDNYIKEPETYFTNKGVWTNWCEFLNYDTSIFIPTKNKWFEFCKENNITTVESYNKATNIYPQLPKDPINFYNDFTNINSELNSITIVRRFKTT